MKTFINPQHLWKYREFDRSTNPSPFTYICNTYPVEKVAEWLLTNEMEPIEVTIIDNKSILVTDGNHRLKGALINGFTTVPIRVEHRTLKEAQAIFYQHTLDRFVAL